MDAPEQLIYQLLEHLGEDPDREGLLRTPERVIDALGFLTEGYRLDVDQLFNDAFFAEEYDEMVLIKDIEFYSLCVPSKQIVNAVEGARPAAQVRPGDRLWTLQDGTTRETTVRMVTRRETRELVEVVTDVGTFRTTPDHPFATREGWVEAMQLEGHEVEWTRPKALRRRRYAPRMGSHHRESFPRVEGYVDGDGYRVKQGTGAIVIGSNLPFLRDFSEAIDARFTPHHGTASRLYISNRWNHRGWYGKHGFRQESHRTSLLESRFVRVQLVRPVRALGKKPFTVYSFTCEPYPTFLISGHLSHNCEHHMLPFFGKAHVGYLPRQKIVGLSKIPRLVDFYARRLQVQERMTKEIAEMMMQKLEPRGVAVVIEARHLCMVMRGVEKQHSYMTTSHMLGKFRDDQSTRLEFMNLIGPRGLS